MFGLNKESSPELLDWPKEPSFGTNVVDVYSEACRLARGVPASGGQEL